MEEKIIIGYDGGFDIEPAIAKEYDIKKLPVTMRLGASETLDDGSIQPDDIIKYFEEEKDFAVIVPPTVQDTFRFFTKFVHMGYTVIYFTSSSKLAPSFEYASSAAESLNKVHVIDSKAYSIGGMPLVMKAAQMAKEGKSSAEIVDICKKMVSRIRMHVLIGNLNYVHSTGQINITQKLMLSVFGMMPSISIEDGYFYVKKNYRGHLDKASLKFADDLLKNIKGIERANCFIGHTGIENSIVQKFEKEVNALADFDNIYTFRCGCCTTTHYGDGGLVLCWVDQE